MLPAVVVGSGRLLRAFCLAGLVSPLLVEAQAAEERIPSERLIVRETIDVRVIHLDAIVRDRSTNEPVEDLRPADFDLRIDGRKVKVTGVSRARELSESLASRLTLVLMLDELHLAPAHRDRVLAELEVALVAEMVAHPLWVAITTFSDALEPVLAPTRDVDAVRAGFQRVASRPLLDSDLRQSQRATTNEIRDTLRQLAKRGSAYRFGQAELPSLLARVRGFGEATAADTRRTLAGAESLVEALSFVPGRKAVLLLSDGLPRQPLGLLAKTMHDRLSGGSRHFSGDEIIAGASGDGQTLNDSNQRPTGSDRIDNSSMAGQAGVVQDDDGGAQSFQLLAAQLDCGEVFDRLAALADTHRVTFYPLKPPVTDPSFAGLGERPGERGSMVALSDVRAGLESLADQTGGLAFVAETGVADFLRASREDVSTYYSISFTPPADSEASGIRELELKVRRNKVRVRHRASYVPITLEERLAGRAWGTLLFDWKENQVGLELLGRSRGLDEQIYELELVLSLPIGKLSLIENGSLRSGSFRAVIQLREADGNRLEPQHLGFVVEIPRADLELATEKFFAVRTVLRVRPGTYAVAVGLSEESTGATSFVRESFDVGGEAPPSVAALY